MLYTFFFCAVIASVASQKPVRPVDQEVYTFSPAVLEEIHKYADPCIQQHGADPNVFKHLLAKTLPNDDVSKNWLLCFTVSGGYAEEDGHFNIPRMLSLVGDHPKLDSFEAALGECNKINEDTPAEVAYALSVCILEKSPFSFSE